VFGHLVPASTGIGAGNPFDAALVADALVVKPKNNSCKVQAVASPLQCPAVSYKSSFSRAVEISYPDLRQLLISGTASIGADGRTVHTGDTASQVEQTMKVVEAILVSRDMGWEDITRAIAYFKDMSSFPIYEKYCSENGLPSFPLAVSHADICRVELLFEIEVDAVKFNE
jgi:enamine deaminase RidA (YjgF/YER057c/UK114 family)